MASRLFRNWNAFPNMSRRTLSTWASERTNKKGYVVGALAGILGTGMYLTANAESEAMQARSVIERAKNNAAIGHEPFDIRTPTSNVRVAEIKPMIPPALLIEQYPVSPVISSFVNKTRCEISDILHGRDDRLVCVVGPCSIHDMKAGLEYGVLLKQLIEEYKGELLIVMRVYFEKPRTTIGWKGLINDPDLNGTYNINKGLRCARELVLELLEREVPTGLEWLDVISPQFLADLVCWGAIGARTTESQIHRQLVSALSMPVGFKNATSGEAMVAANAVLSAKYPHVFSSITQQGLVAIVQSTGNGDCHVIHRGGSSGPNYDADSLGQTAKALEKNKCRASIMVDCSHGNSNKNYKNQPKVASSVAEQVASGSDVIVGVMIESNIQEGKQKLDMSKLDQLEYGKSITDSCVNLQTTRAMLAELSDAVKERRKLKNAQK